MAAPTIDIISVSRYTIGTHADVDAAEVVFEYNQPLVEWEARADGTGVGQGLMVGGGQPGADGYALHTKMLDEISGTLQAIGNEYGVLNNIGKKQHTFIIDDEELTGGDKDYRINVYGKNDHGEWLGYVG